MTGRLNLPFILIADDDADDRLLVEEALVESGVAVGRVFVHDGEQLLDYLNQAGDFLHVSTKRPAFILLDLRMPRMDGREALRQMKADPKLRSIPVVILTTSRNSDDIRATYSCGVNSFIVKPSNYSDLVDVMRTLGRYWFDTVELPPDNEYN